MGYTRASEAWNRAALKSVGLSNGEEQCKNCPGWSWRNS